jgi:hypothetical protein
MEVNVITINHKKRGDTFILVPLGDTHIGNKGCDVGRLRDMIGWIRKQVNCFVIMMGDYCDCINYTDPRFDPKTIEDKYLMDLSNCVAMQTEDFINIIRPIADKIVGFHRGNHEETIRSRFHWDMMHELWKEFHKPILNDAAITRFRFIRSNQDVRCFDVFSQHGHVGGMKGGNKVNRLEDLLGYADADIFLIGHAHIKVAEIKTQLYLDRSCKICHRKKILGVTGSFLRGYTEGSASYVEKCMLPPTDLGVLKITLNPDKYDIHVSM